jgi:LysR family hydrogen peroxide-inducible transcriptional activator
VRKSQGYTLVPALFVETLSESERRDYVREFERPSPAREVSLVYRRDQWKGDVLKSLESTILAQLPPGLVGSDPRRHEILKVRP